MTEPANSPEPSPPQETESELISRAQYAVSQCNWVVGECAARWTQRYAKGRTDSDFGQLVGLSGDQVYQRRRVWETFGDVRSDYPALKWSHFYISLNWDDAPECLQWAEENQATIAELKMWRRALHGEETEDTSPPDPWGGDPNISFVPTMPVPVRDVEDATGDPAQRSPSSFGDGSNAESSAKDSNEVAYAPFRSNAGSAPSSDGPEKAGANTSDDLDTEQLIKRITTTLERINKTLTPDVLDSLDDIPQSLHERFQAAVSELHSKTGHLV
ncbi:MAG: hypothetical protein KDA84_28075 [Planctomycetaceae bacterium]|nr:hypothetical protein [Planctomycetaceae bacterium]